MARRPRRSIRVAGGAGGSGGASEAPRGLQRAMRGLQGFASQARGAYSRLNETLLKLIPTVQQAGGAFGALRDTLRTTVPVINDAATSFGRVRYALATTIPLVSALTTQFAGLAATMRVAGSTGTSSIGTLAAAAGRAAVSTGAMSAGMVAVLGPLAAIAAAAALAYAAMFKWQDMPLWLKGILLVASPLVLAIRAIATAWSIATAPMRAFTGAISLVRSAITGTVTGIVTLTTALVRGLVSATASIVRFGASVVRSIGSGVRSAISGTVATVQSGLAVFNRLGNVLSGLGGELQSLAARIVDPLTEAARQFAVAGTALAGFAAQTGLSVEQAAALGYAAERSGSSVEAMASALQTVNTKLLEAQGGSVAAAQAFTQLGLDVNRLSAMAPEDRFTAIGTAIAGLAAPLERAKAASDAFGSSSETLIDMFARGQAGIAQMRREAERLGLIMTGPQIKAAKDLTDAQKLLKDSFTGLWRSLGAAVAPQLADTAKQMAAVVQAVTAWVKNNQPLIAQVFRIASTIAGVATGLSAVASALAVATPGLVALTAAAAAGWVAWEKYGSSAMQAMGSVMTFLQSLYDETMRVMGGIWDAIQAGDLELAVQIAWLGARKAWESGLQSLAAVTNEAFSGILQALSAGEWQNAAQQAWLTIKIAFSEGLNYLDQLWTGLQTTIDGVITYLRQQVNVGISELAKLALAGIEKISAVARVLEKYDPTGKIGSARLAMLEAARATGITKAANVDPAVANAALDEAAQARTNDRRDALALRQDARTGDILAAYDQRAGLQATATKAAQATGTGSDLDAALARAAAARAAATEKQADEIDRRGKLAAAASAAGGRAQEGFGAQFSGAALLALSGGGLQNAQDRTAKATEAAAKNTAEMVVLQKEQAKNDAKAQLKWA